MKPPKLPTAKISAAFALICAVSAAGCGWIGDFAKSRADKAAYTIVREKQIAALGKAGQFSIDTALTTHTQQLLRDAARLDLTNDNETTPTYQLSLADTLTLAIDNNREYRARRESLYSSALGLTETRRNYSPIFSASADASITRTESGNGTPGGPFVEKFDSRGFSAGVSQILATGANVSLSFTHSFVRFLTDAPRPSASNGLGFNIVQPLLRGGGPLVALEPLRQDERNLIYDVRDFRRYQQSFVIDVADRYYGLLSFLDQLRNAQKNFQSVEDNLHKLKRFADGGRASDFEVDQARQKDLEARINLSSTRKNYAAQLDQFKVFLGLPLDLDIGPDPAELDRIAERSMVQPDMNLAQAVNIALKERLDLLTTRDQNDDAKRRVEIARRNFLPDLNASYNYSTGTGDDKDRVKLKFDDNTQKGALSLILPLDWTPRRNSFRQALIALDQSDRNVQLQNDLVAIEVRDAWRELDDLRTTYQVRVESVRLAERLVKSTTLLLQKGTATARDLLDAQDDLLNSRNAATSALVNHTIRRMRFWNAIERFQIDSKGMWYE